MRIFLGAVATIALGLACAGCGNGVSSASAADTTAQAEPVTAIGCPKAPKPDCVTVTADGKTWDVTGAGVDMSKGVAVQVTGTPGPAGACGATLTTPRLQYTGLQCKAPV